MTGFATLSRRSALQGMAALTAPLAGLAQQAWAQQPAANAAAPVPVALTAAPADLQLRAEPRPRTTALAYGGQSPGPLLRARQGDTLAIRLTNGLTTATSLHWRGMRVPAALDGVGGFSSPAIAPGASADIRLPLRDSGFYLYHPLVPGSTAAQLDAGLYGGLIVTEPSPPPADREILVILDDWRLNADSQLDLAATPTDGQTPVGGNVLTVNGAPRALKDTAAPGARLRLYIANAATTRIVTLKFEGAPVTIVAIDGHPSSTAFQPKGALALLTPGGRMELFVDLPAVAGQNFRVATSLSPEVNVPVLEVETEGDPVRTADRPPIRPLTQNAMPDRIDLARAQRVDCVIAGGAGPQGAAAKPWTLNGARADDLAKVRPLFRTKAGTTMVISFRNDTAIPQPMTVHGHHGRLLFVLDDGWDPFWTDTVLVQPGRTARFAFVADNPGRWLVRSAFASLFDAGVAALFEVG